MEQEIEGPITIASPHTSLLASTPELPHPEAPHRPQDEAQPPRSGTSLALQPHNAGFSSTKLLMTPHSGHCSTLSLCLFFAPIRSVYSSSVLKDHVTYCYHFPNSSLGHQSCCATTVTSRMAVQYHGPVNIPEPDNSGSTLISAACVTLCDLVCFLTAGCLCSSLIKWGGDNNSFYLM